jgi:hypothetical protein
MQGTLLLEHWLWAAPTVLAGSGPAAAALPGQHTPPALAALPVGETRALHYGGINFTLGLEHAVLGALLLPAAAVAVVPVGACAPELAVDR